MFTASAILVKWLRALKIKLKPQSDEDLKDIRVSIFDLVRHLRELRWGTVKTVDQYKFIYEFLEQNYKEVLLEEDL